VPVGHVASLRANRTTSPTNLSGWSGSGCLAEVPLQRLPVDVLDGTLDVGLVDQVALGVPDLSPGPTSGAALYLRAIPYLPNLPGTTWITNRKAESWTAMISSPTPRVVGPHEDQPVVELAGWSGHGLGDGQGPSLGVRALVRFR
jgi:hypothetical protein